MEKVEVIWRDSRLYIAQLEKDDEVSFCTMYSVGYLIKKEKDKVVLAGDLVDDDYRRAIVIPYENIITIKYLK